MQQQGSMTFTILRRITLAILFTFMTVPFSGAAEAADLNVYLFVGEETHGEGEHNYPAFRRTWSKRLSQRNVNVAGGRSFPGPGTLKNMDVLVIYRQGVDDLTADERGAFKQYVDQGGGVVVLHSGTVSKQPDWYKTIIGGVFEPGESDFSVNKKQGMYYTATNHPLTTSVSNVDLPGEEVYWNLRMEDVNVLANSYHKLGVIAPQMWTTAHGDGRVFTWLTGHRHTTFDIPHVRGVLLRGLTWAANRDNLNALLTEQERRQLTYPEGKIGPVPPEEAASTVESHPEFNHQVVAAEPMIQNPMDVRFGSRGHLWVAEANEYPAKEDESRPGKDRILVLNDRDGDGRMDQKRVFAEDLSLVTGFDFYRDGVLVAAPPDLWFLRDTNGDLKADRRTKVLTGLGMADTHATMSNLNRGLDGWYYVNNGYAKSDLKTPSGDKIGTVGGGVFRLRPDGSEVQDVSLRPSNTWGHTFSAIGQLFWTQATSGDHILHGVLPAWLSKRWGLDVNTYHVLEDHEKMFPAREADRFAYEQIDRKGSITAGAGSTLYTGGAWPEKYRMNHFVSDPTIWLTHRDVLERDGLSYTAKRAREDTEFLRSTDYWFAPINQRIGPDGALYVVDFYRQAVTHNDTRGGPHGPNNAAERPDRYNELGRIWRIQHSDARSFSPPQLRSAGPESLVQALDHPNQWFRKTAQRLLIDRNMTGATDALRNLLRDSNASVPSRVHALWTLYQLESLNQQDVRSALTAADAPGLRKNACRVISEQGRAPADLRSTVLRLIENTSDPQVKLEAMLSLTSFQLDDEQAWKQKINGLLDQVQ